MKGTINDTINLLKANKAKVIKIIKSSLFFVDSNIVKYQIVGNIFIGIITTDTKELKSYDSFEEFFMGNYGDGGVDGWMEGNIYIEDTDETATEDSIELFINLLSIGETSNSSTNTSTSMSPEELNNPDRDLIMTGNPGPDIHLRAPEKF